ncbi:substrate-binding domain-containing protein [Pseudomonas defluvii]|nr:substrate-binding domain-containing protein [Pseudomonas defluvii]
MSSFSRIEQAGVVISACELEPVPVDMGHGRQAMSKLLASKQPINAVICSIDLLAQGVMAEAQANGLRVPQDIAVMGFGDLEFAAHTYPRLSTVNVDGGRIGLRTAELLLQRIEGSLGRREHVEDVGFRVVPREST